MTKIGSAPIMYSLNQVFGSRHLPISFPNFSRFLRFPLPLGSNKPGRFREPVRMKKQSFTRQHVYLECTLPQIDIAPVNFIQLRCIGPLEEQLLTKYFPFWEVVCFSKYLVVLDSQFC